MSSASREHAAVGGDALVLSRHVVIKGSITFNGEIRLAGTVEGDIRCKTLQIAERGLVEGNIVAHKVIVFGDVVGTIQAGELVLKTACHVQGEIYHKSSRWRTVVGSKDNPAGKTSTSRRSALCELLAGLVGQEGVSRSPGGASGGPSSSRRTRFAT